MSWLTVTEVATRYNRTERQVRAAIERGYLAANRPPGAKAYRVADADAESLFGRATLHGRAEKLARESEAERMRRQLSEAGLA